MSGPIALLVGGWALYLLTNGKFARYVGFAVK